MNKTCPGCGIDAPNYALLCKDCQFDFKTHERPKRFPMGLSIGMCVLGLSALLITRHLATSHVAKRYVLDVETQSIIIAESTRNGTTANRLPFDQVKQLEHIIGGSRGRYEIIAVINNGDRWVLKSDDSSLKRSAENMSNLSGIEFVEVNNTRLSVD